MRRRTAHEPVRHAKDAFVLDDGKAKRFVKGHVCFCIGLQIGRGRERVHLPAAMGHQMPSDAAPSVRGIHRHWTDMPVRPSGVVTRPGRAAVLTRTSPILVIVLGCSTRRTLWCRFFCAPVQKGCGRHPPLSDGHLWYQSQRRAYPAKRENLARMYVFCLDQEAGW